MSINDYLYPDLPPKLLRDIDLIRRFHKEHADYFTCHRNPYPGEVERFFRSWFDKPLDAALAGEAGAGSDGYESSTIRDLMGKQRLEALHLETIGLYASLKSAKPSAGDSSEAMAYYRTITNLMDKLLSYQERALGMKKIGEFHQVVLDILDDVVTEDQRDEVLRRLKETLNNNDN